VSIRGVGRRLPVALNPATMNGLDPLRAIKVTVTGRSQCESGRLTLDVGCATLRGRWRDSRITGLRRFICHLSDASENELGGKRKQRHDGSIFRRVCMRIDPLSMLARAGCDAQLPLPGLLALAITPAALKSMNESFRSYFPGCIYCRRVGSYGRDSRNLHIPVRKDIRARARINDKYRLLPCNAGSHRRIWKSFRSQCGIIIDWYRRGAYWH
jgi:hypothetical protein